MKHYFSPHTGEHIPTATPADWMGGTNLAPPSYDPISQSAIYQGGIWHIADAQPLPKEVPTSVSMRQARLALLDAGILGKVMDALAAISDEKQRLAAQIEWEYARSVDRSSPWVSSLVASLGLSEADVDALFARAREF